MTPRVLTESDDESAKTTIGYDDYLRLEGLLTLARDHVKMLDEIERAAMAIVGEDAENIGAGYVGDTIYSRTGDRARDLCKRLGLAIEEP